MDEELGLRGDRDREKELARPDNLIEHALIPVGVDDIRRDFDVHFGPVDHDIPIPDGQAERVTVRNGARPHVDDCATGRDDIEFSVCQGIGGRSGSKSNRRHVTSSGIGFALVCPRQSRRV